MVPIIILLLIWNTKSCWANSPPTFVKNIDLEVIKENTPIGTPAFQLVGIDPENSTVHYGVEGTDRFTVNRDTGVLTVAAPIDRERNDSLRFFVTLEDYVGGGHDNNLVRVPVTVIVLDENDNAPAFHNTPYETTVREDTPVGTTVFDHIKVTDVDDVGAVLQIKCDPHPQFPDACDKFSVISNSLSPQSSSASIVLRRQLDYSVRHIYQVKLVADDGKHNVTTAVIVKVGDVQNSPPVFTSSLTGIVNEDDPIGTLVMTVQAKDGDEGEPRRIQYELVKNPEQYFSIDPFSGELRTVKHLDKEIFASSNGVITVGIKATEITNFGIPAQGSDVSSVTALTITIRDVNDEAPTFNKISYTVNLNENVANGTPLPNLDMFVQDTDVGSNSVFNIELIDDSKIFSVEPPVATGSTSVSIRVKNGPLDYENPNHRKFILLVVATETFTSPQLSGTGTVTVSIVDMNDNVPQFEKQEYQANVVETAAPGSVVYTITATDRDSGSFGEAGIVYSLFGNGAERFKVDPSSGVITVAPCPTPGSGNCLDFETRPTYYLSYQAVDDNGKGHAAVVSLTIKLSDANDNAPVFLQDSYSAIIDEGSTKFDPPLRVKAVDADVTSVPQYTIVAGNNHNLFTIDQRSGEISVREPTGLDVSATKSDIIVLTVQASDGGKGLVTTTVQITIKDANNNSPVFQKHAYFATVSESAGPGTIVDQVSASDADTGVNAVITYRIQKGGFDDFVIDGNSGVVTVGLNTKLDYDRRKEYSMEIIAVDGGSPVHTATTTLSVQVLNSNDKAPYFTPSTQRTQVTEGEVVDHIFYTLKAEDPDVVSPNSLTYDVIEPISAIDKDGRQVDESITAFKNFFAVNSHTGEVRVASQLDRELAAVVTLTVIVTDVSATPQQTGTGTLVVTIIDLNDYPPSFSRPWTPERPEISINVMEEQPIGSVVATLVATDPDSNIAAYVIESKNSYFAIDKTSGVITVKSRVDYESVQSLQFTVVAYDTGIPQLSASALVTANVININDNDPIFNETSYHATIMENSPQGTVVTEVLATDADSGDFGKVKYSLLGERNLDFTVDQLGVLRVAAAATLDRELTPSITLQVVATDQGEDISTRRAISVPIYITLKDTNDNPPVFTQREYEASVVANIPTTPPSSIIQIFAVDKDEGENAKITYSITAGNEKGLFSINPETGVIFPISMLEEDVKSYKLRVEARDHGTDQTHIDEAIVHIRVVEINQDKPKFTVPALPNATVEIPENQSIPNFLVMRVEAEDKDRGENGRISYYLKLGDINVEETDEFHINTVTGELRTKMILDRERTPKYQLVLAARDNGSPSAFETLRFLTVVLKDIDDNTPQFPRSQTTNPYVFTLEENLPPKFSVGQVIAEDKDIGANALIYYYIIDGNFGGYFIIEKTSGIIRSNTSFDREQRETYEIVVKATSNPDYTVYERPEEPGFSASSRSYRDEDLSVALVRILISDVNDNVPQFIGEPYLAGIHYSTQVGDVVATVSAVDADAGPNGTFHYRLENINLFRPGVPGSVRPIPSPFNVTDEGHVIATQLMAQYDHSRFILTIAAREISYPNRMALTTVKLWIYEQNQLVRVTVRHPPEFVNKAKKEVYEVLSNATRGTVVIDDIRYHQNEKKKIVRRWTDLFIHVVNDRDEMILIPQVLEAVDSNSKILSDHQIHKIVPAYVSILDESYDTAFVTFITLIVVLVVGIITFVVSCFCLKKWFSVKVQESLVRHDEVDAGNTTENPLWTEQKLKLYEEQELSMSVALDHENQGTTEVDVTAINFNDDAESAVYATLRQSTAGSTGRATGSRLGTFLQHDRNEYDTLNGCSSGVRPRNSSHPVNSARRQRDPSAEHHEYHELKTCQSSDSRPCNMLVQDGSGSQQNLNQGNSSVSHSTLTIDKDGEPMLVAELL